MALQAVYEQATGKLVSIGSVIANPLPAGLAVTPVVGPADGIWNSATKTFLARPPDPVVDRLQDAANHPALAAAWARLTAAQRTTMRKFIVWLLGSRRYRNPNEEVPLEPPNGWPADPNAVIE